MKSKVLLLGNTGKLGSAFERVLSKHFELVGLSSRNFDASDFDALSSIISGHAPDIVINTVAFLGIDPCEKDPNNALRMNTLYPRCLAEITKKIGAVLVHFSTDAVFNDAKHDYLTESDIPIPVNFYGLSKYGGDCLVQSTCEKYYIFRVPILFGPHSKKNQFVEKMLDNIKSGQRTLRFADDILSSPTYSLDVARKVRELLIEQVPFGLYHISNTGKASLFDLMSSIINELKLPIDIERGSYLDFPSVGQKNTYTPLSSVKTTSMRPWEEAVKEYCQLLK